MSNLSEAFGYWQDAVREHRECVDSCQYDAEYFCARQADRVRKAEADFLRAWLEAQRLAAEVESWKRYAANVDEALNSGDGVYRP